VAISVNLGAKAKHIGMANTANKALSHCILRSSTIELANLNFNVSDCDMSSSKKSKTHGDIQPSQTNYSEKTSISLPMSCSNN
jgi:hypothetical protein